MESLDEDGEKGKKRGDIPWSFLLVVFLVFLSREGDIFSSMTQLSYTRGQFKEGKRNKIFRREDFTVEIIY